MAMVLLLLLKSQQWKIRFFAQHIHSALLHNHLSLALLLCLPSTFKDAFDYMGPIWRIHANLLVIRS